MTAHEFKSAWAELMGELRPISSATLKRFNLNSSTAEFLNQAGLPDEAAPFLSFVGDNVKDKYDGIDLLTNWFDFLPSAYSKYIVIGSDGCGDILALNTEQDCMVEWLDHEDGFAPRFMNSSILHLTSGLVAYGKFIQAIVQANGEDAYINSNFTDTQFDVLHDMLQDIDERCVQEGFWQAELGSLIATRGNMK